MPSTGLSRFNWQQLFFKNLFGSDASLIQTSNSAAPCVQVSYCTQWPTSQNILQVTLITLIIINIIIYCWLIYIYIYSPVNRSGSPQGFHHIDTKNKKYRTQPKTPSRSFNSNQRCTARSPPYPRVYTRTGWHWRLGCGHLPWRKRNNSKGLADSTPTLPGMGIVQSENLWN